MENSRLNDLRCFYELLDRLEDVCGGKRQLAECSGKTGWPKRGVYFFFEVGEQRSDSGNGSRIVRVGTHALSTDSKTTLWNRLSQHRGSGSSGGGNHRGSIFRLLVGSALARRNGDSSLLTWGKDQNASKDVRALEAEHEKLVSDYIRAMPFLWLEVDDDPGKVSLRGMIERNAIALLSNYDKPPLDPASPNWLGGYSDREKVRRSGLWNQNHVDEPYNPSFLEVLENLITKHSRHS